MTKLTTPIFQGGQPLFAALLISVLVALNIPAATAQEATMNLVDMTASAPLADVGFSTETPGEVSFSRIKDASGPAIKVSVEPGKAGYPGIIISPTKGGAWDLSKFGHVAGTFTNLGKKDLLVAMRLDNSGGGPQPWNTEQATVKAGETKTVKLIFGHSYGKPAYQLDPSRVVKLLVFTSKPKGPVSWRIDSIKAGGQAGEKPPVNPEAIRTAPMAGGILLGEGGLEPDMFKVQGSAGSELSNDGTWIVRFQEEGQFGFLKPAQGRWDFREGLQAEITFRNEGQYAAKPSARLESNDKKTAKITLPEAIEPADEAVLVVPFADETTWNSADKTSGSKFENHKVSAIVLSSDNIREEPHVLRVMSIKISLPPAPKLPEWLGQRPPVEGDWKLTLEDNFDGTEVNEKIWSYYGSNFWDKKTHFSKKNTIVKDGTVTLRVTKERGHQNDDPSNERVTDYATGFLESYGKWTQKYGYFEARTKLTKSPGVWPAFWLMPDRGEAAGPQWKRADTANGGMEFDIMEQLSGWGLYRYNIAMHWDGYEKGHKATGTSAIYVQPDAEGFITTGLLWSPGLAVFYANGKEVGRHESERVSNIQSEIKFTLPMGGWDNLPMDDSQLPADFVIDYVRVWQRADLAE